MKKNSKEPVRRNVRETAGTLLPVFLAWGMILVLFISLFAGDRYTWYRSLKQEGLWQDEPWIYMVHGAENNRVIEKGSVDLPATIPCTKGQSVSLIRKIPEAYGQQTLYLETDFICQEMELWLNGRKIYSFGTESDGPFALMNPANRIIRLPEDSAGSTLKLRFAAQQQEYPGMIADITVGNADAMKLHFLKGSPAHNFFCLLMLIISLLLMLQTAAGKGQKTENEWKKQRMISAAFVFFSVWLMMGTVNHLTCFFPATVQTIGALLSLYGARALFLSYIRLEVGRQQPLMKFTALGNAVYTAGELILLAAGKTTILRRLLWNQMLLVTVFLISCIVVLYSILVREERKLHFYDVGWLILSVFSLHHFIAVLYDRINLFYCNSIAAGLELFLLVYVADCCIQSVIRRRNRAYREQESHKALIRLWIETMKPHFLYNAFGLIRNRIMKDPKSAYELSSDLSSCIRYAMDAISADEPVNFSAEMDYIRAYCRIQQARFGGRLEVIYDMKTEDFRVPRMSIQSFVELAVSCGILKFCTSGCVQIRSGQTESNYIVTVSDNGCGYFNHPETFQDAKEIYERVCATLAHHVRGSAEIINLPGKGTVAVVRIPKNAEEREHIRFVKR